MLTLYNDSPDMDGFGSGVFKNYWNNIVEDLIQVVIDFFNNEKLLKDVNATFLTLIAKVSNPLSAPKFRPIMYCNTLYKCATQIFFERLKMVLYVLVNENQGAFFVGRNVIDNILIS